MKKTLIIFMCALLAAASAFAAEAAALELSLGSAKADAGKEFTLSVNACEGSQLYTTEFFITFDPKQLVFVEDSVLAGSAVQAASPYLNAAVQEDGRLKVVYTATEPLENGGEICTVRFRAKRGAGGEQKLALEIEHAETFDGSNIKSLDFSSAGGTVTVTPAERSALPWVLAAVGVAAAAAVAIVAVRHKKR